MEAREALELAANILGKWDCGGEYREIVAQLRAIVPLEAGNCWHGYCGGSGNKITCSHPSRNDRNMVCPASGIREDCLLRKRP